ncbi:MAG: alpha-ketoacid dehydrogenase subunit beta [Verrucomicrobia bacterium]|nr:alpha-ketoacid dehydrogenase subunit beta [Verrucomicrobiota bacterium]
MDREITFAKSLNEAIDLCMAKDPSVYIMGLGVPDPTGFFGTTTGLQEKYGKLRVMDMPTSENGMTGVAIGSALVGMRPIMAHHRIEFAILAFEQIMNQAANWHYMFGGQSSMPLVIRMFIGRGWGQGPQHAQSLQAMFAHVPGLKVVMPVTPYDAKGLFISAVEDNNPVIFLEHRWLHNVFGPVPKDLYRVPLGKARLARTGSDVTIVATSYMVLEALYAAKILEKIGVDAEVIDVRSLRPLDKNLILESIRKTGHLVVADTAWHTLGFAAEITALAVEEAYDHLKSAPIRITLPDLPSPSSPGLTKYYYPRAIHIINASLIMLGKAKKTEEELGIVQKHPLDIPNKEFKGPF